MKENDFYYPFITICGYVDEDLDMTTEELMGKKPLAKPQQLECKRCGRKWIPRSKKKPVQCPKCKSPYWNKKRVYKHRKID
jgi:predicted Zn-ribbon and HTH transcriptional regulator